MNIILSYPQFNVRTAALILLGLLVSGVHAQSSGGYEKLFTAAGLAVSDTVSGINLDVNKISPLAQHGDVDVTVLQFGGSGDPYVYEIKYTPDAGFIGVDTFTLEYIYQGVYPFLVYRAFEVRVYPSIVTPATDFAVTAGGTPITLNVLDNDSGVGPLSVGSVPMSNHGTVSLNGNAITFTPASGYTGIAHVNYTVCDTVGTCKNAQWDIGVHAAGSAPQNDTLRLATTRNTGVSMPLLYNGYALFQAPSNGQLTLHSGHAFTYTPGNGYHGDDQFVLSYNNNGTTVYKTVLVRVLNTPEPNKMAIDDYGYTPVNQPIAMNVRQNDIGNLLVKSWVIPPNLPGTVTGTTSGGNFTFTPNAGFTGVATFYYRIGNNNAPDLEMAAVHITVGNLAPAQTTYDLTTPEGTPLIVNYKIPFTDFVFEVTDAPDNGTLTFHPGLTTHTFGAQTISGYNLLIYEPNPGFIGDDPFEVNYCVTANNICRDVKVTAHVSDVLATAPPYCLSECVWTGDLNGDGKVNNKDVLTLGYAMGMEGEVRDDPALEWYGQFGEPWANPFMADVPDLKYIDSDGNGAIDHADTLALGFFYGNTHAMQPFLPPTSKGLPFELDILTPNPGVGDLVQIDVYLGETDDPVADLYGFTFDMTLSPDIVDSALHMTFADNAWTNLNSPHMTLQRRPSTGRLETAFTRTGTSPVSGHGYIGRVEFIIIDVIEGGRPNKKPGFVIFVDGPTAQWGDGSVTQSSSTAYPVSLKTNKVKKRAEAETTTETDLSVFPNPAQNILNVRLQGTETIRSLQLMSADGRLVYRMPGNTAPDAIQIPVGQLPNGLYILQVQTEKGVTSRKVEIAR